MPKAAPKPIKKKTPPPRAKKTPPRDGKVHERMRQASKPNKRSKKPEEQRMREASRPQRRRTMTDNAQQGNNMSASAQGAPVVGNKPPARKEPRGAGRGEEANATRGVSLVDWPPEPKSHRQHVEELLQQAQDNEDYNLDVNEAMTETAAAATELMSKTANPLDAEGEEKSRAEVLQQYKDENDPAERKKRLEGEMKARAERDKKQAAAAK
jgi:hypothetical protein